MSNKALRRRFAAILIGYTLVVLALWGLYSKATLSSVRQSARHNTEIVQNAMLAQLNDEFSRMKIVSSVIAGSSYVQDFLMEENVSAYYEKANAVSEIIRKTIYPQMNTDSIITITADGSYYRFTGGVSNGAIETLYQDVLSSGNAPLYSVQILDGAQYFCHISRVYVNASTGGNPVGSVITLSSMAKTRRMFSELEPASGIDTAILLNDTILLSSNPALEGGNTSELERLYGAVTSEQVMGTNLFVAAAVSKDTLYSGERLFIIISAIMLVTLLIIIIILHRLISARMIDPMLDKADTMKMGLLNTQIDAHFVVNTIACIESLSQQGENKKAATAAGNLAAMLRHLHEADEEINIFSEMENLNRYIEIMNIRGGGRFVVSTDVDDRLSEYRMPGQILQPLVENALTHGLGNKTQDCHLVLIGKEDSGDVEFSIADNGTGIPSEQLNNLLLRLKDADRQEYPERGLRGVALVNIQKRIRMRYGERYGLTVYSKPGEGTTIVVRLPVIEDK